MKTSLLYTILFFTLAANNLVHSIPTPATLQEQVERDINAHHGHHGHHHHHHHHHHHRHHHHHHDQLCPEMRRLGRCMFDIIALIQNGHPLTHSCCQDVRAVDGACHPNYPWFTFANAYCKAVYPKPQPQPPPSPDAPPPAPSPPEPAPAPAPQPSSARRVVMSCADASRGLDSCVDDFVGHELFSEAIRGQCCGAIEDILDTCKPQDWPVGTWFITSTDHCLNRGQH